MIIVIIGIIAVIAIPKFIDLREDALAGVEEGVAGAVRSGIKIYGAESAIHARQPMYPITLDNATLNKASNSNIFFDKVLSQAVYDSWRKATDILYQGPTRTYYVYDSTNGAFGAYLANMTVADSNMHSFLPAVTVNPYNNAQWQPSGTGLYTPWSGIPLDFSIAFQNAGNYTFSLDAINNPNHPGFISMFGWDARSNWTLPPGYTQFDMQVIIDGVLVTPGNFNISASDTAVKTGTFTVPVTAGNHTVSVIWTNDEWTPDLHGDANIQLQNLRIQAAT
jgi:hypothetical protein